MKSIITILAIVLILYFVPTAKCASTEYVPDKCPPGERCIQTEEIGKCLALYSIFSSHKSPVISREYKKNAELFAKLLLVDLETQEEAKKVSELYMEKLLKEIGAHKGDGLNNFLGQTEEECSLIKIKALKIITDAMEL